MSENKLGYRREWHKPEDHKLRKKMELAITTILEKKYSDHSQEDKSKLAKAIELVLYTHTNSFEGYYNFNNLHERVTVICKRGHEIGKQVKEGIDTKKIFESQKSPIEDNKK